MLTPDEWQALQLSAKVAFWATLACLPLGWWSYRRYQQADAAVDPPRWHSRISVPALHGQDIRNVAFFDWHVEGRRGTNGPS